LDLHAVGHVTGTFSKSTVAGWWVFSVPDPPRSGWEGLGLRLVFG